MSISSALSNALSGLTASSRAAGVVSTNLANVLTDGYAVRDIELAAEGDGRAGGVAVVGVTRYVDSSLLNERRMADSALAQAETAQGFATVLEREVGTPDQPSSLSARVAALEASLVSAASKPEEDIRLQQAVQGAIDLAGSLNRISDRIQAERTATDGRIGTAVEEMNTHLGRIQALNGQIANANNAGHPTASMEDQRQVEIDKLAEYVPLRLAARDNGTVAIFTPGGAILLDGSPARLSFTTSNVIAPHMTVGNGLLSGLEINGVPIQTSAGTGPVSGGRLGALFEIRDVATVDAQAQIDALARDLVERFQQPGLDATLGAGDPGLLTDAGAGFDPLNEIGLAGRVSVNAAVDHTQGGQVWRLRDGLGALSPGPAGNAVLLNDLKAALDAPVEMASGSLGATPRSVSGHVGSFVSRIGQERLDQDQALSFATSRQTGLVDIELSQGVDSDAELQRLLLIEQAYSANARMIQTIDEMMQALLRI